MPKYYIDHPSIQVVVDAASKDEACRKVLSNFVIDKNKCKFFFINEAGFCNNQFVTESAYDISRIGD